MKKALLLILLLSVLLFSGCSLNKNKVPEMGITASESSESKKDTINEASPTASPTASSALSPAPSESPEPDEPQESTEKGFDPYAIINQMSNEELAGQLFLARAPELSIAKEKAEEYKLGGYVIFNNHTKNESPESLKSYLSSIKAATDIPMLIAVDEEGGSVARISCHRQYRNETFYSPRTLFNEGGIKLIKETEKEKCELLKSLGINVNLSPVCDITTDKNSFMYYRSIGLDAQSTGDYVSEVIKIYNDYDVGAVLKHFPGYGNNTDTHIGIANDKRSLDELLTKDLIPFFEGIKSGCDAIMVSHTFINALDSELPASLSPEVIGFLRKDMNFSGVIITDDLIMQAITDLYGAEESAVLALEAGADLLCSTEFELQYNAVLKALNSGRLTREQLENSCARILKWKHELKLIN